MTAKEYLGQAYHIDQRINSKIEQVAALRELSVNVSNILSDTPSSGTRNIRGNESVIVKIIDLENEINDDIDKLVDLKREIMESIKKVKNEDSQVILEKRYLCFKQWEQSTKAGANRLALDYDFRSSVSSNVGHSRI